VRYTPFVMHAGFNVHLGMKLFNHVVGLRLYVEEEDMTSWFNAASDNDSASRGNVSVSRKSATSVDVSFSTGMPFVNYYSITYK